MSLQTRSGLLGLSEDTRREIEGLERELHSLAIAMYQNRMPAFKNYFDYDVEARYNEVLERIEFLRKGHNG